ncbi:MAG: hypothetical protein ACI8QZ_001221 [Chlamydiales bacterium]|jgi:hypothetical protein
METEALVQAWWAAEVLRPGDRDGLTLRIVFHLPLRQAEGFLRSVLGLMDVDLEAPDHTTLSRRSRHLDTAPHVAPAKGAIDPVVDSSGLAIVGEGEWAAAKHGRKGKRGWKKLHLGVDGGRCDRRASVDQSACR